MDRNTTDMKLISVIIPAYNEAAAINDTLAHVRLVSEKSAKILDVETIVVDGSPGHTTLAAIENPDVITVESPAGRGRQMNAGAALAQGDILLFLHADTRLPDNAFDAILDEIDNSGVAGAFSLAINSPRLAFKVIAFFANLRTRLERTPYGDQAHFITTEAFRSLGGYADIPIMEDVELFKRIRMEGLPITLLRGRVRTSPRRWEKEGILRRTLTNWWLRTRFALGTSPAKLAQHYRPHDTKAD
jgi:rSAM/selenodomain-associated transferase 2